MQTRDVEAWIRAHVHPAAPIELVHEEPWATVLRVPLADGVAWFKACNPIQAFEPRLTASLAARWPDRMPDVLAHDADRAWLLLGDAGRPLGFDVGAEPWLEILPRCAELQHGEAGRARDHLEAGVPDRRLASFPALYDAALAHDLPVGEHELAQLRAFAPRFAELAAELAAAGIAETIQHDDLHGANVYGDTGAWRILDWGDACVSHPFLTPFVTFFHLEEITREPRGGAWSARLRDAYLEPWGRPQELRDAFELAERLGPFAHLFKEVHVLGAIAADGPGPAILERCLEATM